MIIIFTIIIYLNLNQASVEILFNHTAYIVPVSIFPYIYLWVNDLDALFVVPFVVKIVTYKTKIKLTFGCSYYHFYREFDW